ncbi:lactonase family protein [Paenibacillus sp. P96]|uniref:Lactonase family protein n=2 Tax=Paenibacillus zeirhizosphaerae TaxID=2987519 RepID=A0ABT9FMS4_9BACL|nr:lactonase family protein [Paenibacillus sp. P96]MDP4096000.1 lactonase family protein [Paenibacillus sp. P96]
MEQEQLFYTGTYASRTETGIYLCALDGESGEMRIVSGTEGIERPSFLALSPDGSRLYAVSEAAEGHIYAYAVDAGTGELHMLDRKTTEGADPCYVSVTSDGRYVMASNYSGGNAVVYDSGPDGGLGSLQAQVKHTGSGIRQDRQEGPHPHSIVPDPSGGYVMICDLGLDEVVVYRLEEGKLVTHREAELPPGSGPRHLVFHPTNKFVYVANELNSTVTAFIYNEQTGKLQPVQHLSTLPEGAVVPDNTAADIRVTACGRYLYVSNRGHNSIAAFRIDQDSGKLEVIDWVETFGATPRNFNLLPGGYLIAANQDGGNLVSFAIDGESGRLQRTGYVLEIPSPVCIEPMQKPAK